MSKTIRRVDMRWTTVGPHPTAYSYRELVRWTTRYNPSSSFRKMWRRQHRARANNIVKLAWLREELREDLQVPNKLSETTDIYDWY